MIISSLSAVFILEYFRMNSTFLKGKPEEKSPEKRDPYATSIRPQLKATLIHIISIVVPTNKTFNKPTSLLVHRPAFLEPRRTSRPHLATQMSSYPLECIGCSGRGPSLGEELSGKDEWYWSICEMNFNDYLGHAQDRCVN